MWVYEQSTGKLFDKRGELVACGYAGGNCAKNPEGVNNPTMEGVKGVGPLPRGVYTLGVPVPESQLGPFAIPLTPAATNKMFGRGGFFIHGDKPDVKYGASEGCIILPRDVRDTVWCSADRTISVI